MVTVLILAGGKSKRMGEDKALMEGGVKHLRALALDAGVERIITSVSYTHLTLPTILLV